MSEFGYSSDYNFAEHLRMGKRNGIIEMRARLENKGIKNWKKAMVRIHGGNNLFGELIRFDLGFAAIIIGR